MRSATIPRSVLEALRALPTIVFGQTDNLKFEAPVDIEGETTSERVWVSRVEDTVSVERLMATGHWETTHFFISED